ncbi:MAG: phenylacetate--CoA ligase family protein [Aquabacterium sp.]
MYEKLFRHVLFPGYETLVRQRRTAAYVREYEASQWLSPADLQRVQLDKLNRLLAHGWAQVPFLAAHWRQAGCNPQPLHDISELARYPTLTKQLITAHYDDMIARDWRGRTLTKTTGGSTGVPFRFEYTMDAYARRTAIMWRGYGWAGAGLGTRTAYLWGTGMRSGGWAGLKDRLYHGAFNRRFLDAFMITDTGIDERIDAIERYRPDAVVGYVAPLMLVASRLLERGRALRGIRCVLTGAEALLAPERAAISRAFGCEVFETYGSREVMLMATECEAHDGLHIQADQLLLETVDAQGRPVAAGDSGDLAVTDLHNDGMPMVRYLNGDRGTLALGPCRCGRGLPRLSSVDGRVLEMIRAPDGRHISGEFFVAALLEWPQIRQWQFVQTSPAQGEFRIVAPQGWDNALSTRLSSKVAAVTGPSMSVEVCIVDAIAPLASGKRRLTVAWRPDAVAPATVD